MRLNVKSDILRRGLIAGSLALAGTLLPLASCDKGEPVQSTAQGTNKSAGASGAPSGSASPRTADRSQPAGGADSRVQMGGRTTTVTPSTAPAAAPSAATVKPKDSSGTPPTEPSKAADPSGDPAVAAFAGLAAPKPVAWQWRAPSTSMRAAEYTVPGVEGADQAQIIVYQFAGGGTVESNITRWKSQFRRGDGAEVEAKMQELEADGMKVTVAELTGEYKGMNQTEYRPDQILIAAIVETGGNPVFIQLVGPSKTVSSNREAYMTLLRGLKKSEPMK